MSCADQAQPSPPAKGQPVQLSPSSTNTAAPHEQSEDKMSCADQKQPSPPATPSGTDEAAPHEQSQDKMSCSDQTQPSPPATPSSTNTAAPHEQSLDTIDPGDILISFPPEVLTEGAIDRRIRRIMTPRANGQYLISGDFVTMWNDKFTGGRDKVRALFEKAAYSPDTRLQ